MASVSISKAAKLAGVSRSTLYSTYINKGLVSVSTDERGRKCIDTSELLRVFGSLKSDTPPDDNGQVSDTPETVQDRTDKTAPDTAEIELKMVREQLAEAREQIQAFSERESWYQSQIKSLTDTLKLLEHKPEQTQSVRRWWQALWKK